MKDRLIKIIKEEIENIFEGSEKIVLKSKSKKGNRFFKMLKTAQFQHYDAPKGDLSDFTGGEDDRKRLVSKLGKADKKIYRDWLKTDEGQESINVFDGKSHKSDKKVVSEGTIIDKFGDELQMDKNYAGFGFPVAEYKTNVKNNVVDILMRDRGVSEKSFQQIDEITNEVSCFFKESVEANDMINTFECDDSRSDFAAESIYHKFLKK